LSRVDLGRPRPSDLGQSPKQRYNDLLISHFHLCRDPTTQQRSELRPSELSRFTLVSLTFTRFCIQGRISLGRLNFKSLLYHRPHHLSRSTICRINLRSLKFLSCSFLSRMRCSSVMSLQMFFLMPLLLKTFKWLTRKFLMSRGPS
jgi:hypothetical protein